MSSKVDMEMRVAWYRAAAGWWGDLLRENVTPSLTRDAGYTDPFALFLDIANASRSKPALTDAHVDAFEGELLRQMLACECDNMGLLCDYGPGGMLARAVQGAALPACPLPFKTSMDIDFDRGISVRCGYRAPTEYLCMTRSAAGTVEAPGRNVAAKRGLNRAISSAGWGGFDVKVGYKLAWRGGELRKRPAAWSSCTCADCGHVDAASRVSQASFACTGCGVVKHADVNAAQVMLQRGLAVEPTVAGCGGSAMGRPKKQQLRTARRGRRNVEARAEA